MISDRGMSVLVTGKGDRKEDRCSSTREVMPDPGYSRAFDGVVQPSITSAQSVQDRCLRAAASTSQ